MTDAWWPKRGAARRPVDASGTDHGMIWTEPLGLDRYKALNWTRAQGISISDSVTG
jgi:hypothetical protein